jgi:hypothetical protein
MLQLLHAERCLVRGCWVAAVADRSCCCGCWLTCWMALGAPFCSQPFFLCCVSLLACSFVAPSPLLQRLARDIDERRSRLSQEQLAARNQGLHRTMAVLQHASECHNPQCGSNSCSRVKAMFNHALSCTTKLAGQCPFCRYVVPGGLPVCLSNFLLFCPSVCLHQVLFEPAAQMGHACMSVSGFQQVPQPCVS